MTNPYANLTPEEFAKLPRAERHRILIDLIALTFEGIEWMEETPKVEWSAQPEQRGRWN